MLDSLSNIEVWNLFIMVKFLLGDRKSIQIYKKVLAEPQKSRGAIHATSKDVTYMHIEVKKT